MNEGHAAGAARLLWIHVGIWALSLAPLALVLGSQESVARLRNALIAVEASVGELDWTPDRTPPQFLQEASAVPPRLVQLVKAIGADAESGGSELDRSIRIAGLLASGGLQGGALQLDTMSALTAILERGAGYCADYTQVFNALAYAARVPVRQWGFTFDRYGARGHTLSEVYDFQLRKWVMIDAFNSFYVRDRVSNVPLSVMEFRNAMSSESPLASILVVRISDRFPFKTDAAAISYFSLGQDEYFLFWGNNSLSYDANPWIRAAAKVSRSAHQFAGIVLGVRPEMRLLPSSQNEEKINSLKWRKWFFWAFMLYLAALTLSTVRAITQVVRYRKHGR